MSAEGNEVIVAWCRCGPFARTLDRVRRATDGDMLTWNGNVRWVSHGARLEVGQDVLLCQADLCHRPGYVVPLGSGRMKSVVCDGDNMSLVVSYRGAAPPISRRVEGGKLVG